MNQWLVAFGVLGSLASIFSVGWAFYSTAILKKAVRVTSLREIRTLINRLNEDKKKLEENSPAWMTMHHTQQNLDALFKSLQNDFGSCRLQGEALSHGSHVVKRGSFLSIAEPYNP